MVDLQGNPAASAPAEVSEEQKFTAAFTAAIDDAEKKAAAGGKPRGSRIIQVTTREEHEKQAMTLSAFITTLTQEFMD